MANTQSLFDALAAAGGHAVDRPGLNAYVMQGQSMAGLRSAQTEEALLNAQKSREEQQARGDLESALSARMDPSEAHLQATEMIAGFGDAKTAAAAEHQRQLNEATAKLGNPTLLGSPEQTAAQQAMTGKVAEPVAVPNQFTTLPGAFKPDVQVSPMGAADITAKNAEAGLHTAQAQHPEQFHAFGQNLDPATAGDVAEFIRQNPNLATNIRSLVSNGGAQVVRAFIHGGAAPGGAPPAGGAAPGATPGQAAPVPFGSQPQPNGITPGLGVNLKEQADIRHDFANGLAGRQTSSLNTMVLHSNLFDQIADQLQNGNFTPTNAISQSWARLFGSPVPSNLQIAAGFLGREAVRATVNSGAGTGQERELAVNEHSSPEVLHGAAQTLRSLAGGQLQSLKLRAQRGGVDINQLLGPEAQSAYGSHGTPAGGGGGGGGGALPPQALAALKEGHVTTFGNGQRWTLQNGQPAQVQ